MASSTRDGADGGCFGGVLRHLEADLYVTLRREVVHLVRLDLREESSQQRRVGHVAVVQVKVTVLVVRILVDVVEAMSVDQRRAANDAVDLVALLHQLLGEIRAVLPADAGDQRPPADQTCTPVVPRSCSWV